MRLIEIQKKTTEKLQVKNLNEVMANLSTIYAFSTLSHRHRHLHLHTDRWLLSLLCLISFLFGQIKKVTSKTTAGIISCVQIYPNNQQLSVWWIKANSLQNWGFTKSASKEATNYHNRKIDKTATVKCKPIPGGHQQLMTRPEDTKGH